MGALIRVEVTDQHGMVALIVDTSGPRLRPAKRDQLAAMADGLVADINAILGFDEAYARKVAVATLARLVADDEAYERVAERRGLLPL